MVGKSSHFHIRDIRCIQHLILPPVEITLANFLVSSRLDHCNSLYFASRTSRNSSRFKILLLVSSHTPKYQHITPVLKDLHWLPITQRIEYKISLLTFKAIMNGQPSYLHQLLIPQTHYSSTRSSQASVPFVPRTRTSTG